MRRFIIVSSSSDEASNDSESLGNELNDHSLEEEDFESNLESDDGDNEWKKITGRQLRMNEYAEEEEFLIHNMDCDDPVSLYKLFVTDHILEIIAEETNKYATQCINNSACSSTSHQRAWKPVTKDEINAFFDILLIMGIVQVPEIRLYWSQNDIYANARIKNAMKRDRFISILKYLHFSDNTTARAEDRLHKIRNVVEAKIGRAHV